MRSTKRATPLLVLGVLGVLGCSGAVSSTKTPADSHRKPLKKKLIPRWPPPHSAPAFRSKQKLHLFACQGSSSSELSCPVFFRALPPSQIRFDSNHLFVYFSCLSPSTDSSTSCNHRCFFLRVSLASCSIHSWEPDCNKPLSTAHTLCLSLSVALSLCARPSVRPLFIHLTLSNDFAQSQANCWPQTFLRQWRPLPLPSAHPHRHHGLHDAQSLPTELDQPPRHGYMARPRRFR